MSLFVTGTDTGVGKTFTVVQLLRLLRAAGRSCVAFKPICCGDRRDAELLLAAGSDGPTIDEINPVWLKTPAAPLLAAQKERLEIDTDRLCSAFNSLRARFDHIVVEGVGGWLVPIKAGYFVSDLAAEFGLPVLVVAQNRLGCLNHTMLTLQSVERRKLRCAGVVLNSTPEARDLSQETNAGVLRQVAGVPILAGLSEKMGELPAEWRAIFDSLK